MGITLELADSVASDVHVLCSPLAELTATLHVLAEPEHHPERGDRLQTVGARLDDALLREIQLFTPLWARYRCRLLFPLAPPAVAAVVTADDELDALAAFADADFSDLLTQGIVGTQSVPCPAAGEIAAGGRAAADWLATCERKSFGRGELARLLLEGGLTAFRQRLLDFLTRCREAFADELWRSCEPDLRKHAALLVERLHRSPVPQVIASLSPTAVLHEASGQVRFDKLQVERVRIGPRPLVVLPSRDIWPHLLVKREEPLPVVVQVSAAAAPPLEELSLRRLRERLLLLSSPGRMELCRHLLGEAITTSELAQRLDLSASQVSRSIGVLREAGLVQSERDGKYVRHRLRTDVIARLGADVLATVMR